MGVRVTFNICSGKSLKELVVKEYSNYRKFILDAAAEYPSDYAPEQVKFLNNNPVLPDLEKCTKKEADMLVDDLLDYCDHGPGRDIFTMYGAMINRYNYSDSEELILDRCGEKCFRLWTFLYKGRSLRNSEEYFYLTRNYGVVAAYWSREEQEYMFEMLSNAFRTELKKDGIHGIKAVIDVIGEVKKLESELIIITA